MEPLLPTASADPVVAEEVGHPVSTGIGALGGGAAGAAMGVVAGPLGVLVGAAVGALAGGLAGSEMAAVADEAEIGNGDSSYTLPDLQSPARTSTAGASSEPASGALLREVGDGAPGGGALAMGLRPVGGSMVDEEEDSLSAEQYPQDEIRTAAYYRYLVREREGRGGDELEDWVEAEREVLAI